MKAKIHVNQHVILDNRKHDENHPCITVKTYKANIYCHEVQIDGPSRIVYSKDFPLGCGAHVWIEAKFEDLDLK